MIDEDFINKYPRLYPICSVMGIIIDQVDELMCKLENKNSIEQNVIEKELVLKAIPVHLNKRNEKLEDLKYYKDTTDLYLRDHFGLRQVETVKKLLV